MKEQRKRGRNQLKTGMRHSLDEAVQLAVKYETDENVRQRQAVAQNYLNGSITQN